MAKFQQSLIVWVYIESNSILPTLLLLSIDAAPVHHLCLHLLFFIAKSKKGFHALKRIPCLFLFRRDPNAVAIPDGVIVAHVVVVIVCSSVVDWVLVSLRVWFLVGLFLGMKKEGPCHKDCDDE